MAGKCGKTARVMLEAGMVTVYCTLERHEDRYHYDEVFSMTWSEYGSEAEQ